MKVLLSIKPEYADRIFSGTKKFEFRRSIFRNKDVKIVVVYATLPVGKVVGQFEIDQILCESPKALWELTEEHSGVKKEFYEDYFEQRELGFAIKVRNPTRYRRAKDLNEVIPSGIAPQSFCYL